MRRLAYLTACPAFIVLGASFATAMPEGCPGIARGMCVIAWGVVGVCIANLLKPRVS